MTTRRRIDHGTFCYTAVKEGLIDVERSAHVGIRTVVEDNLGIAIHDAREVHAQGGGGDRGRSAGRGRAMRPSTSASTSTGSTRPSRPGPARRSGAGCPRRGGVFLRGLAGINLVGGDVVEVSPPFDPCRHHRDGRRPCHDEQICLWGWTRR
jgi:agmatinase